MAQDGENKVADAKAAEQKTTTETTAQPAEVKLSAEQYNALLDRLAELESLATASTKPSTESVDVDTLAEEGRRAGRRPDTSAEPDVNLDEMTNTQLVQYIADVINRQGGERLQRLEVAIESLRVAREIDRCEAKYKDFWEYEPDIRRIAIANPSLSIEQAYKLAKSSREETSEAKSQKAQKESVTQKILNLPPRTFGEKPGAASSSTTSSTPLKTMRQAAQKAWEEVVGKDKGEIS